MNIVFVLFFCSLHICFNHVQCQNEPTVVTNSGIFRGSIMATRRNRTVYAFRGIRYAESPEGNLRFQPPRPITAYSETVDATADGPMCPQPVIVPGIPMSEDCLRINVYTRRIPTRPTIFGIGLVPVVFYIHGGSLVIGSGISLANGPQYLLDKNVVLVTINHRLGALGYMSTGTAEAPGNNGFKDQVAALRWVQRFIIFFGGDPNRVTLMGFSAGALSVSLLVVSPMSQGLFSGVIVQSASAMSQVQIPTEQFQLAQKHAGLLNCDNSTAQAILDCMKTLPAMLIGGSSPLLLEFAEFPIIVWLPIVEPDFGQERFLIEDPLTQLRSGRFNHIPVVCGITTYEVGLGALGVLQDVNKRTQLDQEWNRIAPIIFIYERNTSRSNLISQQLRQFYLGSGPLLNDNATAEGLTKLFADGQIGYSVHRFAYIMAEVSRAAVYYYKFSYTGRYSGYLDPATGQPVGTVHGDDVFYLLPSILEPMITLNDPESDMVDIMTTMWANHATVGRPIRLLFESPLLAGVNWPRLQPSTWRYLNIGDTLEVESRLYDDRFNKWDELFPLN